MVVKRDRKSIFSIGPAALVAAAFIGPGTVTTCSIAGARFGYSLLWALLFSVIATIILQEMSARLGVVGKKGLGEALRDEFTKPFGKIISIALVISAIVIGNAAYETGNIMGGVMGLEAITGLGLVKIGDTNIGFWGPAIGIVAFILLYFGNYRAIETGLVILVIIMSLTFIGTGVLLRPGLKSILGGLFTPNIPAGGILTVAGLIGTTIVPYNLFLHSSAVKNKWNDPSQLKNARIDSFISIGMGGVISMAIVVTSATAFYGTSTEIKGAADMALQLNPLLGNASGIFLSLGLLSAGLSSAITAPLAAAYATSGILGWKEDKSKSWFRYVWMAVLLTGIIFSSAGINPVKAIFFAQVTNGILLPLVAVFLIKVMNNASLLGKYTNGIIANILGFVVVCLTIALSLKTLISLFKTIN